MTKRVWSIGVAIVLAASTLGVVRAQQVQDGFHEGRDAQARATLLGINEVPPIFSEARGSFSANFNDGTIRFRLRFEGLAAPATVAHIHFAPKGVAGAVMIFLCGGGNQPACPAATEGTVEGVITSANVTGPTAQGIGVGELTKALIAISAGQGYANVHNATFPNGEIRGQVRLFGQLDD
jgi:hypothetical protein